MGKILSFIKEHKKLVIGGGIALLILIIAIVAIVVVTNMGPMGYKKKVQEFGSAFCSEKKMKEAIKNDVDLRAAVAWQEADQKSKDFKDEYKDVKKDSDDLDELKDALVDYAKSYDYMDEVKISDIKKPKKDKKNGNIWTVKAKMKFKSKSAYGYDLDYDVKFVFYKNKIIDITDVTYSYETSFFEKALKQ